MYYAAQRGDLACMAYHCEPLQRDARQHAVMRAVSATLTAGM